MFRIIMGRADKRSRASDLEAHQLVNEINRLCSDGIWYNVGVRQKMFVDPTPLLSTMPRDPVTGQRLQKGDGNCPSCHTGMMKEIHPSAFWHCQNCGINRGGSFKPEPQAAGLVKNSLNG
jgi:ribosomal protein L37AE/L43A